MNVLAIGNSFSQDATRYLHQIAKSAGQNIEVVNLYIGGCPLSQHYRNMLSGEKAYFLEVNGHSTGFLVSLKEALLNRDWDVVTLQQASFISTNYETFQPYLNELSAYIKKLAPKAKQVIHQTWAYEDQSHRLNIELGYNSPKDMFNDINKAYNNAAEAINAYKIIPSGYLFTKLIQNGINKIHRDTFHASLGIGRYALGLLWYQTLTGQDVYNITFSDFDEEISEKNIQIVKKCVGELKN